jgi:hypothetical protein
VDQNWGVYELANTLPPGHGAANVGETLQQFEMVQDGIAEAFGSCRKVGPRVVQNFLKLC